MNKLFKYYIIFTNYFLFNSKKKLLLFKFNI